MNNQIKYIRFGFENVEATDVDISDIDKLSIKGISKSYYFDSINKRLEIYDVASDVFIKIKESANQKEYRHCYLNRKYKLFKRLTAHNDIVDIALLDENKKEIRLVKIFWSEDSEYDNRYQVYNYDKSDLVIRINSNLNLDSDVGCIHVIIHTQKELNNINNLLKAIGFKCIHKWQKHSLSYKFNPPLLLRVNFINKKYYSAGFCEKVFCNSLPKISYKDLSKILNN